MTKAPKRTRRKTVTEAKVVFKRRRARAPKVVTWEATDDRYFIPDHAVPEGFAYQWASALDEWSFKNMEREGWSFVPPSRHPNLPEIGDRIESGGLVLMQHSAEYVESQHAKALAIAKEMHGDAWRQMGIPNPSAGGVTRWDGLPVEAGPIPEGPFIHHIVEVPVKLYLSERMVEAAAIIGISPQEYGRRLLVLFAEGRQKGILYADGGSVRLADFPVRVQVVKK